MGTTLWTNSLISAMQQGKVTQATVDEALRRQLLATFQAGRFDPPESNAWTRIGTDVIGSDAHTQVMYEAALQSMVLLKNDANTLPLKPGTKVAVVGPQGVTRAGLFSDYAADQFCWDQANLSCVPTLAEGIAQVNGAAFTTSAQGVAVNSTDTSGEAAALALAQAADVVILALGIDKTIEHEGHDRPDTALPGQQEPFAQKVLALGRPTVLVLTNGGQLAIDTLIDGPAAIVEFFNPNKGGAALGDALFGVTNKWGKLPVTMYPHAYIDQQSMTNYHMAPYNGLPGRTYRYYAGEVLFPFGHGLSLTTFSLACSQQPANATAAADGWAFSCDVKNAGARTGDEVVLVYHKAGQDVRAQADAPVPIKSLVEFDRQTIAAGATATFKFELSSDAATVVNAAGEKVLLKGTHSFVFSRGHGEDVEIKVTV